MASQGNENVISKQLFIASQHESQPASTPRGKRKFSRQTLTHAYYAFATYVRREGHLYLYEVFFVSAWIILSMVSAKTRHI